MESNLIRVFHNQLVGKDYIEFDLYNSKGILIHKKECKIDPDFLLMISYIAVYRKEEPYTAVIKEFEDDEISQFLQELLSLAVKKEADLIEIEYSHKNITILFFKNSSIIEKSEIDSSFYTEILDKIKTLFDIKIDFDKEEYEGSSNINIFNKTINIKLYLKLNQFNKFNMIFEIINN
ncbi:MAG TPA: hypothetical protein DDW90_04280 [Cyanobacteria bacterium UBA9971]|nr:hypothetical protein [Cyanobacteria bacterium UBA9971]